MQRSHGCYALAVSAIALAGMAACTAPPVEPAPPSESETSTTAEPVVIPDLTEGIGLSDDGQIITMAPSSTLDVYCIEGEGRLAISFVGEGVFDHQVVACGVNYEGFDTARANDLAEVNLVTPMFTDSALQLRNTEYVEVQCAGDRLHLVPRRCRTTHRISLTVFL